MLYANLLLNVLYHINVRMKIREFYLQNGILIYKMGISVTKQDFHLQNGILALQTGISTNNSPYFTLFSIICNQIVVIFPKISFKMWYKKAGSLINHMKLPAGYLCPSQACYPESNSSAKFIFSTSYKAAPSDSSVSAGISSTPPSYAESTCSLPEPIMESISDCAFIAISFTRLTNAS